MAADIGPYDQTAWVTFPEKISTLIDLVKKHFLDTSSDDSRGKEVAVAITWTESKLPARDVELANAEEDIDVHLRIGMTFA